MKKWVGMLLALLLLVSLGGCGEEAPQHTGPTEFSPDYPQWLQRYSAPWFMDVSAAAKQDGKMHYYFMSSRAMVVDVTSAESYQWGDACLIVFPEGQTMLIDAGKDGYAQVLLENLHRMGVEKLDYFLIASPQAEHCLGAVTEGTLFDTLQIGQVLYNGVVCGDLGQQIQACCEEKDIPLRVLKKGDVMEIGQVRMEVLWPLQGTEGQVLEENEAVGNASLVVRFDYKEHASLFAGDLYEAGEALLMEDAGSKLDVDFLKVPNHGNKGSSSAAFIAKVSPEIAMATGYVLSEEVRQSYESSGAVYLYDMFHGYVHVATDGSGMEYDTIWSRAEEENQAQ